jgi:hypothetical protein
VSERQKYDIKADERDFGTFRGTEREEVHHKLHKEDSKPLQDQRSSKLQ